MAGSVSYRTSENCENFCLQLKMPLMLQRQVRALLSEHYDRVSSKGTSTSASSADSFPSEEGFLMRKMLLNAANSEKVQFMQLHKQQQDWQV